MVTIDRRRLLLGGTTAMALPAVGFSARAQDSKVIKIGAFGPQTGPNAVSFVSLQGTSAYIKSVNDAGGIGGYTFDYIILDDQYNPALTVSAARKLIEQEKVLALVNPIGTGPVLAVKGYLESMQVPSVGVAVSTSAAGPYIYLLSPDYTNEGGFQAQFAIEHLEKNGKLALLYQNDDIGKAYLKGAEYIVGRIKNTELVRVPFQQNTLDFTPAVGTVQQSGAPAVIVSGSPNIFAPIVKAAESLSFRPQWVAASYHGSPQVLKQLPPEQTVNMYFVTYTAVPGTPDCAALEAALQKYYPGTTVSSLTTLGWSAASIFVEAFKRMVAAGDAPSSAALVATLNSMKGYSNSVIRNITYVDGPGISSPHIPRPYEAIMKWNGDGFDLAIPFGEVAKVPGEPGQ
jgi:branched-chain amino acid transport system substrate-binding protein